MKHNRNRRYFKYTNVRTGKSTYYGCGLTVNDHMVLMRIIDDTLNEINRK